MAKEGWIKLQRTIEDNWVYNQKPFDKCHAWIDLLLLAEHKTHKKMWRGSMTDFKRGDVCMSIERLAERWGWSRKKVRHFLEQLEGDEMVHLNAHQTRTTITLVNYGFYQGYNGTQGTLKERSGNTEGTPKERPGNQTIHYKDITEGIENNEEGVWTLKFDESEDW